MPNANYRRGRDKEYRVKRRLEKEGLIVLRTAGSHGFADLIAIDIDDLKIRFIQCKPNKFSETQINKLMQEHKEFNNEDYVWDTTFEVI